MRVGVSVRILVIAPNRSLRLIFSIFNTYSRIFFNVSLL